MTKEEEVNISRWLNGDLYLRNGLGEGLDSKDTDYDKMVESPDYVFQDQAYISESPKDPYEYYRTKDILDKATDCSTSIGGTDGKNFDKLGMWRRDCKIFYPVI